MFKKTTDLVMVGTPQVDEMMRWVGITTAGTGRGTGTGIDIIRWHW